MKKFDKFIDNLIYVIGRLIELFQYLALPAIVAIWIGCMIFAFWNGR